MKKLFCLIICSALLICAGCSDSAKVEESTAAPATVSPSIDIEALAQEIYDGLKFDDTVTNVPGSSAIGSYFLPESYTGRCAYYISTAATPEELAVFESTADCSAEALMLAARERITSQSESYASYAAKEVPKLDSAIIYECDGIVVVCVSADNESAEQHIKSCLA